MNKLDEEYIDKVLAPKAKLIETSIKSFVDDNIANTGESYKNVARAVFREVDVLAKSLQAGLEYMKGRI